MIAAPTAIPVTPGLTRAGLVAKLGERCGVKLRHVSGGGWCAAVPARHVAVIGADSPLAALLGAIRLAYLSGVPS